MANRLFGLWHDAIIGGHDQDNNIGDLGAAGAHGGEGFMARRIQEGDLASIHRNLVGAGALGDATGFATGHIGVANAIQ